MIELVVCDMAGTTVHDGDAVNASFCAALAAAGVIADPAAVNSVMGLSKPQAIRILLEQSRDCGASPPQARIDLIHDDFVSRMRDYYSSHPAVREVPGAAAMFAALRGAGIKIALNTGFNRAVAGALLSRLGWNVPNVIDAVITSDEVPRGRPFPDMIQALMNRLGVHDARHVAKVGDTKVDLEEGANAGCGLVIGVTTGSYSREQLSAFRHTHIMDSVADLPGLLLGAN